MYKMYEEFKAKTLGIEKLNKELVKKIVVLFMYSLDCRKKIDPMKILKAFDKLRSGLKREDSLFVYNFSKLIPGLEECLDEEVKLIEKDLLGKIVVDCFLDDFFNYLLDEEIDFIKNIFN